MLVSILLNIHFILRLDVVLLFLNVLLLMQVFTTLPETLDEIDAKLNEEQSRAECFTGLSENVSRARVVFSKLH